MATITKRGDHQYQVRVRQGKFRKTKTFETLKRAREWAAEVESDLARGQYVDRSVLERTTLGEALERYRDDIVPSMKSHRSIEARIRVWLKHPLSDLPLATLKTSDFLAYAKQRQKYVTAGTVRRDLAVIGATFKMVLNDWGQPLESNMLRPVLSKLKPNKDGGRRVEAHEERAILEQAQLYSADAAPCIILAIETGMRRGELALLNWTHVDLVNKVIRLQNGETKNGDGRVVPLTARAEATLRAMPRSLCGKVFSSMTRADSLSQMFIRVRDRAGAKQVRFHDLRHEAASRFAAWMPTATLAKIMGWRSLQMAMRYYKADETEMVGLVRRAEQERLAA